MQDHSTDQTRPRKSNGPAGIRARRGKGGTTFEAWIWSPRDKRKIRKSFPTMAAAKGWRVDAAKAVKDRKLRAPTGKTLRSEVAEWLEGARAGEIRNKREQPYKPGVIRQYELAVRLRVLPTLGDRKLADISERDLMDLKEQLLGQGCSDSTVRNSFVPLQAIYRRARRRGDVPINPTLDLGLPTAGRRDRAATPAQAAELLDALNEFERALFGTAFYAGLRRGELRGLRNRDVDFEAGTISVVQSWDAKDGPIAPKSVAGTRTVFMLDALRPLLEPLRDRWADPDALFFGSSASVAFEPRNIERKARRALAAENERRAETDAAPVEWFGLHEARHSFSTYLDHAGVSESRADRLMGHASAGVAGRYRQLLPGQLAEDARRLDAFLAGAVEGKVVSFPSAESAA
jgi:integrase